MTTAEVESKLIEAGRRAARAHSASTEVWGHRRLKKLREPLRERVAHDPLLSRNARLIETALKEVRGFDRALAGEVAVNGVPRAKAVAAQYLDAAHGRFDEETLGAFLDGYQEVAILNMAELWALKPALEFVLLASIAERSARDLEMTLTSLRRIGEGNWKELFENVSIPDRILARDPAGAYSAMDYESRDAYRTVISDLAHYSKQTESRIAEEAVRLAERAIGAPMPARAKQRRAHVGFYLVDKGIAELRQTIGYAPRFSESVRQVVLKNPTLFYLVSVELLFFTTVFALLSGLDTLTPIFVGFLMLAVPATQAAVDFVNTIAAYIAPPRSLPKLDFSKGIPADAKTLVAVPSLLLNEAQVRNLVLDVEIRFLANRNPNLYFALLTDGVDSDEPGEEEDPLTILCRELVEGLNRRYGAGGRQPFFLLHRRRMYNPVEGRWMGWERKRGKLLDLNQLLRGVVDNFPVKTGDLAVLPQIRYVITVDSDTQLPRDSAAKLIGAIAHPLNQAVVDPESKLVVEGYGILQPRVGISIESASRSRLAGLYSGHTGFDIYTRAVSDVYQDLFGEGIFTGKGIYEVDTFRTVLEERFPENALLSHDLIEGSYARAALVSDIELIDDYPSHFSAYSRRKHRWVRGDWQIMRWLLAWVPDFHERMIANPISLISRWKIFDNLRRSLIEPFTLLLFLAGWFYLPGGAKYWTVAALIMLFLPVTLNLLLSFTRAPFGSRAAFIAWAKTTGWAFLRGNAVTALWVVFLLHQSLLSLDAIWRSLARVLITRKRLLEWETAAEAENATRRRSTVDIYLEWTPWLSIAIGFGLLYARPQALPVALPIIVLWFASRGISDWLNRRPRPQHRTLDSPDTEMVREEAERIHRFFKEWSGPQTNWLIPDHVFDDGRVAMRLSPTNAGMLLNARIAAVHFGFLTVPDFVSSTRQTLDRLAELEKFRGHLLNWYNIETLAPLEPRFVSTVDSGNLAACLWTLKQASLAFAAVAEGSTAADLEEIAAKCQSLVEEMDFSFLYQRRKKVLSVGYNVNAGRLEGSSYDLLASESRIAAFVAIAKGDVPQEAWFHLGRRFTLHRGERVLLSWTGTMFEYLMPALWMRHYAGTITEESIRGAVRAQRDHARRKFVPWGISESACSAEPGSDYGYHAFGVPQLAMKTPDTERLVISPYSTFLAMMVDAKAAVANLRKMAEYESRGRYGFYEAIDYSHAGGEVIRSWMAHHQGMSLLAACNVLYGNAIQKYFHDEPHVMATELLLHERVPAASTVEPMEFAAAAG